ncbi:MAG TPA: HAD-IIIA family hydrolase [Alphaproteobacteria bacterium]|nr:HAD-IIIA family hydrolase [Alphaproteobacteria bacterium]
MKIVLLDRDGVINVDRPDSVKSRDDFVLLPDVISAVKLLNEASIPIAIVTNQAVVGRGELSPEGLEEIHEYLRSILEESGAYIDKIYTCTSCDSNNFHRKPNPGLLLDALDHFQVKPQEAILIGDALRDLEAASAIKCPRVLVRTGKGMKTLEDGLPDAVLPVSIFNNFYEAVSHFLNEKTC